MKTIFSFKGAVTFPEKVEENDPRVVQLMKNLGVEFEGKKVYQTFQAENYYSVGGGIITVK